MNQSTLKTFAQNARRKLRELVGNRLDYVINTDTAELRQQAIQVNELRTAIKTEGRDPLIERVAYTWFNRLAALRFMDTNGYHPFGARVLTPATANETLPELLQQARAGALDPELADLPISKSPDRPLSTAISDLLAGRIGVNHPEAHVYRFLLVGVCNYYHRLMPFMFEKIGDATELLLPEDLLTEHSIVHDFRTELVDDDCRDVEVIGWLYQYYISERKDAVMARNAAVPREDIPAVTQLFTPHWIVRYLVENSLGRLWLLNRPQSRLRDKMPYYIEGEAETDFLKIAKPEEIRLLDPAEGSGHMLTYAFDLLYAIYEEEGYDAPEIPSLILKHNLYGVDICDRAAALAAFALTMKARSKDNRFFRRVVQPNVISLQDARFEDDELGRYFNAIGVQPSTLHPEFLKLLNQFEDAKNFGSLIQPCLGDSEIVNLKSAIAARVSAQTQLELTLYQTHAKILQSLDQAEYLCQRYHVVVTNPPYMGNKGLNAQLKICIEEQFSDFKTDLFAVFVVRSMSLAYSHGYLGFMCPFVWMFISSYEVLRRTILKSTTLTSLIQLEYSGFDGATVPICTFTITNCNLPNYRGGFIKLSEFRGSQNQAPKTLEAISNPNCGWFFRVLAKDFGRIPGVPIAFWVSERVRKVFQEGTTFEQMAAPRQGLGTTDNARFTRFWSEVSFSKIGFKCRNSTEALQSQKKWFAYNKGGGFQKWFGNEFEVVNWEKDGEEIRQALVGKNPNIPRSEKLYFKSGITWGLITSAAFSARWVDCGALFDVGGSMAFPNEMYQFALLGLLNSKLSALFLKSLNPTLNFQVGDLKRIPILNLDAICEPCGQIVRAVVQSTEADWHNFETSWDFCDLPLLRNHEVGIMKNEGGKENIVIKGRTLGESWAKWKSYCDAAIRRMQELETENNRLFIEAYGLQDELKPEVPENQITLALADAKKDMAAFLSYAVGCMMGRYSLDSLGLILADAGATVQDYLAKVPNPTFQPDSDGIIPVLDGEWFTDDIVGRFREFLRVTFGEETFAENIAFIEQSLGKDLRKYFAREFYKNHISNERAFGYKKRPIYWMFSSPEGSFQALVYLHRYKPDTLNLLLNDYVREFIHKLEERQRQCTAINLNEAARPTDRTKAVKELSKIDKMLKELRVWERDVLLPLAQQRIAIDLDDGVKVNYLKFKGAVVNIPGLDKGDEE